MFLKRIDVIGFKSFADKTGIEFSTGITSVVGPNGSGKSNIADAIRWVLGEQSARNLRGSKMEDVIFAGSETRRATNFCEVSLTLDNSDGHLPVEFNEVVVTRRVYRSGESEYLLNKQTCRLKDIMEIFMDSGMGRESYSIIGQGRIEEMLSTRPEDRRGPFEDAAGIVKYKFRRKDAERKLEETSSNLVRVDDVLAELRRQAGPLEAEAKKAEQYKLWETELTSLDVSLLVRDIESLKVRWQQSAADVEKAAAARETTAQELASKDAALHSLRLSFEAKSSEVETVSSQLMSAVEERQRSEGQAALLEERIEHAKRTAEDRLRQQKELEEEMSGLQQQWDALRERHGVVQAELELRSGELEAAVHAVDPEERVRLEAQVQQLNAELIELHHEAAGLRNEIKMSEESLANEDRRRERLDEERARWQAEVERWAAILESGTDKRKQHAAEIDEFDNKSTQHQEQLREAVVRESAIVSEIHQAQSDAASLRSRLELLRELEEGYDGYAQGARTVLQAASKERLHGVHGALAELMHVDKQNEAAIETALGAALQNIVVETEADARAAIDMLKQRHAGRATFMPMSVIKSRRLHESEVARVNGTAGFIGLASDLVRSDAKYQTVIEHLLGNVVVAEKLLHANDLAKKLGYRFRIVTLEGDVVSPGGVMSGGSHTRKGPGLLGRTREKDDVERRLQESAERIIALQQEQRGIRTKISAMQAEQQQWLAKKNEILRELAEVETVLREAAANQDNAIDRLKGFEWEFQQLSDGQNQRIDRVSASQLKLTKMEEDILRVEDAITEQRQAIQKREQQQLTMQEALTGLRVTVATLRQESDGLLRQEAEMKDRMRRLRETIARIGQEVRESEDTQLRCQSELEQTTQGHIQWKEAVEQFEGRLTLLRQERQYLEGQVAESERAYRVQQQAVHEADEQLHRAEVLAERVDMELNHALRKMGDTYHMTFEWAKEHYPPVEDPDAARRAAESLRRRMAALGDVHIGAIDEWARLFERMEFLIRERNDLEEARLNLVGVIAEIDDEMSRRFLETFEAIRDEFQVAFRNLFGGGKADLALTNPDDLLNTGIEVEAQPPGKKLQNLNLMSGGERALTAMALLFAILKVRPVPFCVLDEVEAALDEANVSRFAQQLRRFSTETQFIVITHRRGTMEEADALYGVTMQESGVSSLIGVRLADLDPDVESA